MTESSYGDGERKRKKSVFASIRRFIKRHVSMTPDEEEPLSLSVEPSLMIESDGGHIASRLRPEEAWMQANYNARALVYIFIIGCVLLAVYYVLEPFLHALIWAVLVGMVLHPFKHACTSKITESLQYAQDNDLPLSLATLITPFIVLRWLSATFEEFVRKHINTIISVAMCEFAVLMITHLEVLELLEDTGLDWHYLVPYYKSVIQVPLLITVVTLSIGIATVSMCNSLLAKILLNILWFALLLLTSFQLLGPLALPLVVLAYVAAIVFLIKKHREAAPQTTEDEIDGGTSPTCSASDGKMESSELSTPSKGSKSSMATGRGSTQTLQRGLSSTKGSQESQPSTTDTSDGSREDLSDNNRKDGDKDSRSVTFGGLESSSKSSLGSSAIEEEIAIEYSPASSFGQNIPDGTTPRRPRLRSQQKYQEVALRARENSNFVFVVLIVSCVLVCIWKYPLFQFFFGFLLLLLLGRIIYPYVQPYIQETMGKISHLYTHRRESLFPSPVAVMGRAYLYLDHMVLTLAIQWVGSIVTSFIIIGLLAMVFVVSVMVLLQIQVELSHYLTQSILLWNGTMSTNPDMNQWIGDLGVESESLGAVVQYGRGFLKNKLHSLLAESNNQSAMVDQVMGIFDRLYNQYFLKESSSTHSHLFNSGTNSFSSLSEFFSENLEVIFSVLHSLGAIMSANISVALSIFYAVLQVLFSGGTALVNMIVFATALFYLLNLSDDSYLPVQWVMEVIPQLSEENRGGSKQGEPFQRAIKSVFYTSFRRAGFYGLYIWLTHTVMGVSASVLPSVLGALAAAVPFVQPYWVFLLAVLELWLIKGELFLAVAMIVLMLFPDMFIYSLINEEIEGAHPYLTGLAIAGGIYFAGLEGALIGPMLLCCLLCFVDIYEDIFNN